MTTTYNMNCFESHNAKRYTFFLLTHLRALCASMLMMLGTLGIQAQTWPDGLYYIKNTTNNTNPWYLWPSIVTNSETGNRYLTTLQGTSAPAVAGKYAAHDNIWCMWVVKNVTVDENHYIQLINPKLNQYVVIYDKTSVSTSYQSKPAYGDRDVWLSSELPADITRTYFWVNTNQQSTNNGLTYYRISPTQGYNGQNVTNYADRSFNSAGNDKNGLGSGNNGTDLTDQRGGLIQLYAGDPKWAIESVLMPAPTFHYDDDTHLFTITYDQLPEGYDILYTTDGSDPTVGGADVITYTGEAGSTSPCTVKAVVARYGIVLSAVASQAVDALGTPPDPVITPSTDCSTINTITITSSGATIYYTTDGSEPSKTNGTLYSGSFLQTENATIKAVSYYGNNRSDNITTYNYTAHTPSPTITVHGNLVTISGTGSIYYTLDGSDPTTGSTPYSAPFTLADGSGTVTIKAIAQDAGKQASCPGEARAKLAKFISSIDELNTVAADDDCMITADIDASTLSASIVGFTGTFEAGVKEDGTYYTISGLTKPLFASANGAVIKNVMLKGVSISGSGNVGALVGEAGGYTRIYNCGILPTDATNSSPSTVSATGYCGGLVGWLKDDSRVINCFSYANITGGTDVAGIVGHNEIASTTAVTDGKYANLRTAVVNCMFYGNITGGSNRYPVYGGAKIANNTATGINNYDYYRAEASLGLADNSHYNCSWPAKEEYLTRYEYFRNLLNSNRELCGWWVGADVAPSTMSTAAVQAVPKDASLMAKWVLDPAIAPYPILKPFGKYASPVNQDPEKRIDGTSRASSANWEQPTAPDTEGQILGSIKVSIDAGAHHSGSTSRDINITAMDIANNDFCYGKIQLPYYNDVFGNPASDDWATRYGGNYGDYVVVGWKITSVTDDGRERNAFVENWETGYNFADRNCTAKDNGRIFAQGGYYYVPEGVTGIKITAQWANAIYLDNGDNYYDRVNFTHDNNKPGTAFAPAGTRAALGNGKTVYTGKIATIADNLPAGGTVYDNAIVLVGNHQYCTGGEDVTPARSFTIMSADLDFDNEPDYCLDWQLGIKTNRQSICPIRFDFLPVVEIGLGLRKDGATQYYSLGCYRPLGHFEVTETSLIRFGQFEFSNVRTVDSPIILNGGIFEQYTKGTAGSSSANNDRITYIILGGNVRMPSFTPGAHVNASYKLSTRHCAVNVLGGNIGNLYLTGNYNDGVTPNKDNPHCYIDGGYFQQVAAAGKEGIDGNVFWKVNHSVIKEFYGGGTLADKRVTGDINVTIDNSKVTKFCGGPKFGDMNAGKTVTTSATGTTFDVYYGGGNGGTSYVQYDSSDGEQTVSSTFNWNGTGKLNGYTAGSYRSGGKNYMANYDMEIINVSTGTNNNNAVYRTYFYAAQFSATNTGSITNELNSCTVNTNFYGGGNLGGVNGDVTSTLTGTHVYGSAFGAGYSASVPEVTIYNKDKTAPSINVYTGIITPQSGGSSTTYTWTNDPSLSTSSPISADGKYYFTEVPLTNLGAVSGNVTLDVTGGSVVEGNAYSFNQTTLTYTQTGTNVGGVFGGGDESKVSGTDKLVQVNINTTSDNHGTQYINNVFGGGNNGDVASKVEVNVVGTSYVKNDVYGGGKGQTTEVGGDVVVNIGAKSDAEPPVYSGNATIDGDVYGGSALGNTNATKGDGWTTDDLKLTYSTGKTTQVNLYGGDVTGNVFGGGLGQQAVAADPEHGVTAQSAIAANVYGPVTVTVEGGTADNVFGCNDLNGAPQGTVAVLINGTATATVSKPNPVGKVYGGGNLADYTGSPTVTMTGGTVDKVFGGGYGASAVITGNTSVTLSGGTVNHDIYGGGEEASVTGNVSVSITGGTVTHDVYGGGALADTNTASTVAEGTTTYPNTTVSLTGGTVDNVYGGGLGRKEVTGENPVSAVEAKSGNVLVELNNGVANDTKGCVVNQIFGGNNANGTPLGTVTVHVYKTQNAAAAHIANQPGDPDDATIPKKIGRFDVVAVYGGGNMAAYNPADAANGKTVVIIEGCDETSIGYVYGGGNAAPVPATDVTMNSSYEVNYLFGGGNGAGVGNPGADVGILDQTAYAADPATGIYGTGLAAVQLIGGTINYVYGGSNTKGNVRGGTSVERKESNTCPLKVGEIYGAGQLAPMDGNVSITLECMPDDFVDQVFGGAKNATINGNVTLTVTSGKFGRVFGGNNEGGSINGSITVNVSEDGCRPLIIGELYGGGYNAPYSIWGCNDSDDDGVWTPNTPAGEPHVATDADAIQVNVFSCTSVGKVFGGGYGTTADVVGNTHVWVNTIKGIVDTDNDGIGEVQSEIGKIGQVFGGGNAASVKGDVLIEVGTASSTTEDIGVNITRGTYTNSASGTYLSPTANEYIDIAEPGIYGGGFSADVDGNVTLNVGTVSQNLGTNIAGNIFGGGYGASTTVTGDIVVNVGKRTNVAGEGEPASYTYAGYATISGDVYGGSAKGKVNATKSGTEPSITYAASAGTTAVNLYGGTIAGNLYGGGYGLDDADADVYGAVTVNVLGGTVPNVYGGNNLSGVTRDAVNVHIGGGTVSENVYGGGNAADALADVTVTVTGGSMVDVYGGGKGQTTVVGGDIAVNIGTKSVSAETTTYSGTGTVSGSVYGGSALGAVNATKDPSTGVLSAAAGKTTAVNVYSGSVAGSIFGGGLGDVASAGEGHADIVAQNFGDAAVTMEGGTVSTAVYGGSNANGVLHGNATVTIAGGTINAAPEGSDPIADVVFGGGYGQPTRVYGDVEVNIGTNTAGTLVGTAIVNGNVYGGSAEGTVNGTSAEANAHTTQVNLNGGTVNGALFGGGLGTSTISADVYGAVTVTTKGGTAQDLFGCNNVNGAPKQTVAVVIDGGTVSGSVYGGGKDAPYTGTPTVTVSNGTAGYVYGGGLGSTATITGGTSVTVTGGRVTDNVYGGGSRADVTQNVSVSVTGGRVEGDVYGGGALANTNTDNWNTTTDTWNVAGSATTAYYYPVKHLTKETSVVTGYYTRSGSEGSYSYTEITAADTKAAENTTYYKKIDLPANIHDVAANGTTYTTTVSATGGVIGNIYGGGLGQLGASPIAAMVYGDVAVTVDGAAFTNELVSYNYTEEEAISYNAGLTGALNSVEPLTAEQAEAYNAAMSASKSAGNTLTAEEAVAYNAKLTGAVSTSDTKNVARTGRVFGCNNLNGTPKGNVTVRIVKTVREDGGSHVDDNFEILAVYGGGNAADYVPQTYDLATEFGQHTRVIVDGCTDVSIEKVYGGGNAADVPFTDVLIEGAFQIGYVFGGGNGGDRLYYNDTWHENLGANVTGYANVLLRGGTIGMVFGGSDTRGSVGGAESRQEAGDCPLRIVNYYGAGNGEQATSDGDVFVTVSGCSDSNINKVFGGSYKANIKGNITLNIKSGIFTSVYGGNDRMGSVGGNITVNIEETDDCTTPIIIQNLFGGCYETPYPGANASTYDGVGGKNNPASYTPFTRGKITVNVKAATRIDRVYGGSYKAGVNGDTEVNINMTKGNRAGKAVDLPEGYRGNPIPNIKGVDTYNAVDAATLTVGETSVDGLYTYNSETGKYDHINNAEAKAESGITYYALHTQGTIDDAIGTIGDVYGGGYQGTVSGNATVNIGTETELVFQTTGTNLTPTRTEVVSVDPPVSISYYAVRGAHITGDVFGGGQRANVTGDTEVNICAKKNGSGVYEAVAEGPEGVSVGASVFGGGSQADVLGNTSVTMSGGYIFNGIFGGGLAGSVGVYEVDKSVTDYGHSPNHPGCIGKPVRCTSGGTCTVVVNAGQIGPIEVATEGMTRAAAEGGPVVEGWVWGAGQGAIEDPAVDQDTHFRTYVNNTDVTIGGTAFILSSIIGGGEFGRVLGNTSVKIQDDCQIGVGAGQTETVDGVLKPKKYTAAQWTAAAEAVTSGTASDIEAAAATMPECSHFNYTNPYAPFDPYYDKYYDATTGLYKDNIPEGFSLASTASPSDGHTWIGCVFGGGSGYMPYEKADGSGYDWMRSAGRVEGSTQVHITGGHILTNVYGGNEYTDVTGDSCVVIITGGTIGVPRTQAQIEAHPVICNLFGGGKGDQRSHFNSWTDVQNTRIYIGGTARIYGSVFGGGEDGHVSDNTKIQIYGGTIGSVGTSSFDGNVFGGGRGFSGTALTAGTISGNAEIDIHGGTVLGNIYGGGRMASVGVDFSQPQDPATGQFTADGGNVTINISGSATVIGNTSEDAKVAAGTHTTGGNVYGGGMGRLTLLDGTPNPLWVKMAQAKSATISISGSATVKSNVYGGAEFGTTRDDATINISGSAVINGSVYGGGYGSDNDEAAYNGTIAAGSTTYLFTPMMYAGCLGGNTYVNISGGTVGKNVYGGGELATVGVIDGSHDGSKYINIKKHTDSDTEFALSWPYDIPYIKDGKATVTITDGRIGGSVYGGGKGKSMPRYEEAFCANVRETDVQISYGSTAASTDAPANCIVGEVYGGGQDGHIMGNAAVSITGGLIGQSVFGGGQGEGSYRGKLRTQTEPYDWGAEQDLTSWTAGKVYGNTFVTMSGGRVLMHVYGGGNLASVGKGNYASGADDYYPSGYGEKIAGNLWDNVSDMSKTFLGSGKATVRILDGEVGTLNGISGTVFGTSEVTPTGMVFGGSRGRAAQDVMLDPRHEYAPDFYLGYVNATEVTIGTLEGGAPHIYSQVFGGGRDGHVRGSTHVIINNGFVGQTYDETTAVAGSTADYQRYHRGNVYGSGSGLGMWDSSHHGMSSGSVTRNTTVDIYGGTIYNNVYGGGALSSVGPPLIGTTEYAPKTWSLCQVNIHGGIIGDPDDYADHEYGGNVYGASRGRDFAEDEDVDNFATTLWNDVNVSGGSIAGNVYGGGQGGRVKKDNYVRLTGGNIAHDAYGGGQGTTTIAADVGGSTTVELNPDVATTGTKGCVVDRIFGCNNQNGTPKGKVKVHVYATQNAAASQIANSGAVTNAKVSGRYDVTAVYGGGNLAEYWPTSSGDRTEVTIDGCDLTSIRTVYGGSNAAPAPATYVRVNGTFEIDSLFGGGNGKDPYKMADGKWYENPGANVGYHHFRHYVTDGTQGTGTYADPYDAILNSTSAPAPYNLDATTKEGRQANYMYGSGEALTEVVGGLIHHAWGGSNERGNISTTVESRYQDAGVCDMLVEESTGGSNNADLDAKIIAQLDCVENMDQFFGGSTNADVNNDIELTITNGTYRQIFGGNNTSGAINGSITVNIVERGCKPIIIGELYAGGYLAPYSIYGYQKAADGTYELQDGKPIPLKSGAPGALTGTAIHAHPRINIISATRIGTIYGGGYQAMVVGDPHINVNMEQGRVPARYANESGGASKTDFTEGEHGTGDDRYVVATHEADQDAILALGKIGNIYGGGNEADIIGNTYIEIGTGRWITSWDEDRKPVYEDIDRNEAFITGNVYGGGRLGHVGDFEPVGDKPTTCAEGTGQAHILISNGEIGPDDMTMYHLDGSNNLVANDHPDDYGHVFGGGQGTIDYYYDDTSGKTDDEKLSDLVALIKDLASEEAREALIDAKLDKLAFVDSTEVIINGTAWVKGCVFGGGENGHVLHNAGVKIGGDSQIGNGHILRTDAAGNITVNRGVNRRYTAAEWAAGHLFVEGDPDIATPLTAEETALRTAAGDIYTASLPECASWPYGQVIQDGKMVTANRHSPYDKFAGRAGYDPEGGSTFATSGRTFYGSVFGGGSGFFPYAPGHWLETAGEVEGTTWVDVTGGHILTSLYGANEMSSVLGDAHITMSGGTVGVPRTLAQIAAHPVTCYVFGGGKGEARDYLDHDTNVQNTTVDVSGGLIYGSVFGGAEDGHVIGDAKVRISGGTVGTWGTSYVDGNIFGGGRGFDGYNPFAGCVEGNTDIQISGGQMLGSIYGGGRLGSVGINSSGAEMADTETETHGHVTIDISGGVIGNDHEYGYYAVDIDTNGKTWTEIDNERAAWLATQKANDGIPNTEFLLQDSIAQDNANKTKTYIYRQFHTKGGNVYCGGMGRFMDLNNNVVPRWFNLGMVKSTKVTIHDGARIKSCVYGGGELGQVTGSYRDASLFEKKITTVDGKEVAEEEKPIPTRTSETLTDILIEGGEIGSDIKDAGGVTRLVFGAVYGGGYGDTQETLYYTVDGQKYESNPKFTSGIIEGNTRIEMQDGTVHSSIYGGGKVGNIHGNTSVTVSGGTVGKDMDTEHNVRFGGQFMGNVYGGGAGNRKIVRSGQIFGNTNVSISQAEGKTTRIFHNIYGGGAFGSVGKYNYDVRLDTEHNTTKIFGVESLASDGTATITVTGGTIGYDGHNNGMVFGSSRGDVSDPHFRDNFMAFVGNTIINIGNAGQGFDAPQPQIRGSVYGSGENGHVMENTSVNIHSGTIGITDTEIDGGVAYPYRGNVYGSGCGTDTYIEGGQEMYNPLAGAVLGNTEVNITGGHVVHNVYGGGSMGAVGFITDSLKHASITDGFGISWPYEFKYREGTGTATINITGGRIGMGDSGIVGVDNGNIYGGARGAAGERYYAAHLANVRQTKITIDYPGETPTTDDGTTTPLIAGSVFGGGEEGHVYENTQVFMKNGRVGHSLFGGGRGEGTYEGRLKKLTDGTDTELMQIRDISTGKVYGNTYLEMSGGHVVHNILGGGYMASVGKGNYAGGADDYYPTGYGETLAGNLWTSLYAPDPEKAADDPVNIKDNAWHFLNSGKTYVNVKGGTVGSLEMWDGLPSGSIFGGSRGMAAPNIAMPTIEECPVFYNGYVNETYVHVYDSTGVDAPRIYGSIYGGGQDGHVRRDTHVIVDAGEIGLPYTDANRTALATSDPDSPQWLHRGNVYGAGSGIGQYAFDFNYDGDTDDTATYNGAPVEETGYSTSAGSVTRFTQVDVNGGTIHRNVYGGGSLASVGAPDLGQGYNPYKLGDTADGHGPGRQSFCTVNIAGTVGTPDGFVEGFVYNPAYGGEVYGASRGISTLDPTRFANTIWTRVNVYTTAIIRNNVFGGGDAGEVREDTDVRIGEQR